MIQHDEYEQSTYEHIDEHYLNKENTKRVVEKTTTIVTKKTTTTFVVDDFGNEVEGTRVQHVDETITKTESLKLETFGVPWYNFHKEVWSVQRRIKDKTTSVSTQDTDYGVGVEITARMKQVQQIVGNFYVEKKGHYHINGHVATENANRKDIDDYMTDAAVKHIFGKIPYLGKPIKMGHKMLKQKTQFYVVNDRVTLHFVKRNFPKSPHAHTRREDILQSDLDEGGKLYQYRDK